MRNSALREKSGFSRVFLLVLTKFSFWQEDRVLGGYYSMKFYDFPDIF